jgi:large subunit ribosomal protein L17
MRHNVKGRKLNRTSSHKRALMRTLLTQLLEYKRIHTTEAKAKELRPYAEKMITKARLAYQREQQGLLDDGQKYDVHTRRLLGRDIRKKEVIEALFDEICPEIGDRPGGYTRIVKTGIRKGDSGRAALIELVDYNREIVGNAPKKAKKKAKPTTKKSTPVEEVVETAAVVAEETTETIVDTVEETAEVVAEAAVELAEEVVETTEEIVEELTNDEVSEETNDDVKSEDNSEEETTKE